MKRNRRLVSLGDHEPLDMVEKKAAGGFGFRQKAFPGHNGNIILNLFIGQ